MRWTNGIKRLFVSAVIFLAVATAAYYIGLEFLFSRRSTLIVPEIIGYVVIANIVTIIAIFALYRTYQWIMRGFKTDRDKISAEK
jgi:hydrogenase-4 membrane subunit HyfE